MDFTGGGAARLNAGSKLEKGIVAPGAFRRAEVGNDAPAASRRVDWAGGVRPGRGIGMQECTGRWYGAGLFASRLSKSRSGRVACCNGSAGGKGASSANK